MIKSLNAAMDNLHAWRLGEIANKASNAPHGDLIDTGLILTRLLEEKGYLIVLKKDVDNANET